MDGSSLNQSFLWCGSLVHPQLLCTHLKLKQNGVQNIVGVEVDTWICLKALSHMKKFVFHKECVAKQATSDAKGALTELPPRDD